MALGQTKIEPAGLGLSAAWPSVCRDSLPDMFDAAALRTDLHDSLVSPRRLNHQPALA